MSRWKIDRIRESIVWNIDEPHTDDIEMSGLGASQIVTYGKDEDGSLVLKVDTMYPSLRRRPNDTTATFMSSFEYSDIPHLRLNGEDLGETPVRAVIDGILRLYTRCGSLTVMHCLFPAVRKKASYDIVTVKNTGDEPVELACAAESYSIRSEQMGVYGVIISEVSHNCPESFILMPGETRAYGISFCARLADEEHAETDYAAELSDRIDAVKRLREPLLLDTGCDIIDTEFSFAKLRACESVFDTRCGALHSPGGYSYYAAVWCNDEIEYANPFFAYTGNPYLNGAALNSYMLYAPFMGPGYAPIPSSIIAEGVDYWNGAGDRGDAAMYLYGATRFALACGDRETAQRLLRPIEWCAEYCRRKINSDGIVESDSDELENRFPSGRVNLCTQALAVSGFRTAAKLELEIGSADTAEKYVGIADELEASAESFFAADIHGFKTYRYCDTTELLRSWICMPLCVGMTARAQGTADALLSEYLLTDQGIKTSEDNETVWDRSTLYALRGLFASGETDRTMNVLRSYSQTRLLGERVPYPVEAYPEGNRRHLSGESALYCKIFIDGIIGLEPESLTAFSVKPNFPDGLDHLYLKNIRAHGGEFDIMLERDNASIVVGGETVACVSYGERVRVDLKEL